MRWSTVAYGASALVHLAMVGAVARIPKGLGNKTTVISMFDAKKHDRADEKKQQAEDKPKPKPQKRDKPSPEAARAAQQSATENTPPPQAAQEAARAGMSSLPDFGISLGGLSVGGPGIAIPVAGLGTGARPTGALPSGPAPKEPKAKVLSARPKAELGGSAECDEETVKPRQLGIVRPQYTDAARAAGIEGKVRVEITIGFDGEVTAARIVSSLGHGLDEAAVTAAKRMTFAPATRCGRPVESTFTIAIRFSLVE